MANSSNFNETFRFRSEVWLNDTVLSCILAVVALYLLAALAFHEVRVEKPRKERFRRLSLENKFGVLSKYTCILIAIAALLRHLNSLGMLWLEYSAVYGSLPDNSSAANSACTILPPVGNVALTVGGGLVYLFLWFRQRVFYIHPSLKILSNKFVTALSFGILIMWIFFWIALYFAYFIIVRYHFTKKGGCLFVDESALPYGYIIFSWTAVSVFMQVVLLGLFIYPILKRSLWRGHQSTDGNSPLMRRVKKAVALAAICFLTDVLSVVATIVLFEDNTNSPIFMYSVNLTINQFATIACFDYWKKLLWPWNCRCGKSVDHPHEVNNTITLTQEQSKLSSNFIFTAISSEL